MDTLDINAIRDYLISVGCKIEYPILVNAFKQYLYNPDPNVQGRIRTKFKDYVNQLATVSLENNMKFIILRSEFRPIVKQIEQVQSEQSMTNNDERILLKQHVENNQLPPESSKQHTLSTQPSNSRLLQAQQTRPNLQQLPPPVPQHQKPPAMENLRRQQQMDNAANRQQINSSGFSSSFPVPQRHSHSQPVSRDTNQYQQQQPGQVHQQPALQLPKLQQQSPLKPVLSKINSKQASDVLDTSSMMMPPPPPPVTTRSQTMARPESLNLSPSSQMPPPRPPPRRRQSTASLFKASPRPIEKSKEIHELARKSSGRVREHALKLNSSASSSDLKASLPMRNISMKENRLSRDSTIGSLSISLQRSGSQITSRSRSSHREDESDSSSLQPIDPLRRKWAIEACNCNYNGLLTLLREDRKLASYKDIINGYTALHWAAKFGNLDIIKLIAGAYGVSVNIKSSAGHTPLHVAYMFNRLEAADLLLKSYKANPDIRDHSGKRPMQYWRKPEASIK